MENRFNAGLGQFFRVWESRPPSLMNTGLWLFDDPLTGTKTGMYEDTGQEMRWLIFFWPLLPLGRREGSYEWDILKHWRAWACISKLFRGLNIAAQSPVLGGRCSFDDAAPAL